MNIADRTLTPYYNSSVSTLSSIPKEEEQDEEPEEEQDEEPEEQEDEPKEQDDEPKEQEDEPKEQEDESKEQEYEDEDEPEDEDDESEEPEEPEEPKEEEEDEDESEEPKEEDESEEPKEEDEDEDDEPKEKEISYDGTIYTNLEEHADELANAKMTLAPHQRFVKNFLSFQNPYRSLLLFHGIGTGKTCTAIGVCENFRQTFSPSPSPSTTPNILIVCPTNLKDAFRSQLFNADMVEEDRSSTHGWKINGCSGDRFLQEMTSEPTIANAKTNLTREKIIETIETIVNSTYRFLNYSEFQSYLKSYIEEEDSENEKDEDEDEDEDTKKNKILIVIDEVHNIYKNHKLKSLLETFVQEKKGQTHFLFLSATPVYQQSFDIIWILNLMHVNDRNEPVRREDIFDKQGNFRIPKGKQQLIRKAIGYVSFVRGENPYTFPYRIYPKEFAKEHTFPFLLPPLYDFHEVKIPPNEEQHILDLFVLQLQCQCNPKEKKKDQHCLNCQYCIYTYMSEINDSNGGKYVSLLSFLLQALIISYPNSYSYPSLTTQPTIQISNAISNAISSKTSSKTSITDIEEDEDEDEDEEDEDEEDEDEDEEKEDDNKSVSRGGNHPPGRKNIKITEFVGQTGLQRMMNSAPKPKKGNFSYRKKTLITYGRIFHADHIGKYSVKIKNVLDSIFLNEKKNNNNNNNNNLSEGIILVFSNFVEGGLIPMALALEEHGFQRFSGAAGKNLFKTNYLTQLNKKFPATTATNNALNYALLTAEKRYTPNIQKEFDALTDISTNATGQEIKVVLISSAVAEGFDFKCIRQVHFLDPCEHMSSMEQIIGRAVRQFSHKVLPFPQRNVQLFLYGTICLETATTVSQMETADLYLIRKAETKAKQIGKVTRALKQAAIDCVLHHDQTHFTQEKFAEMLKQPVRQELSTGQILTNFSVGDAPYSAVCDYMKTCTFDCATVTTATKDHQTTNNQTSTNTNTSTKPDEITQIKKRIKQIMQDNYILPKSTLFAMIQTPKQFPYESIVKAVDEMVSEPNEYVWDQFGTRGKLAKINHYYYFLPPKNAVPKNAVPKNEIQIAIKN